MVKNYISGTERRAIEDDVSNLLLAIHKSYPEDSLLDIVKSAIPGVRIVEEDIADGIRGVIYKKSKDFETPVIIINKKFAPEVKTFALAHELGHYLLGHPGGKNYLVDKIVYDGSNWAQFEAKAQYFAASLLMPKEKFSWLCKVLDEREIAKRFGVTVAAVRVRKGWLHVNE